MRKSSKRSSLKRSLKRSPKRSSKRSSKRSPKRYSKRSHARPLNQLEDVMKVKCSMNGKSLVRGSRRSGPHCTKSPAQRLGKKLCNSQGLIYVKGNKRHVGYCKKDIKNILEAYFNGPPSGF